MPTMSASSTAYPSHRVTIALLCVVFCLIIASLAWLLSIDDLVVRKQLISDDGPVQLVGQTCIAMAFASCLFYAIFDKQRRGSYLPLSYLLMFYTLREADYHYKVSEFAKATQVKRFYSHEMIPISTKLFMASIIILFLVVFYRYLKREKPVFIQALKNRSSWAVFALAWACIFGMSQIVDQLPMFHHTAIGPVFEEVFESSAEVLALCAVIAFRIQVRGNTKAQLTNAAAES
jgi:hypothetical protein